MNSLQFHGVDETLSDTSLGNLKKTWWEVAVTWSILFALRHFFSGSHSAVLLHFFTFLLKNTKRNLGSFDFIEKSFFSYFS